MNPCDGWCFLTEKSSGNYHSSLQQLHRFEQAPKQLSKFISSLQSLYKILTFTDPWVTFILKRKTDGQDPTDKAGHR